MCIAIYGHLKEEKSFGTYVSFLLNGLPSEELKLFEYLGLNLSSDLSSTNPIDLICAKVKNL